MKIREDLDIEVFLEQQNKIFSDHDFAYIDTPVLSNKQRPSKVGGGVSIVSSSKDLEPYPSVCWDVNGYYRDLGVFWRASKRQLMEAYRDLDGPNSERLTYVFRQLLQRRVRQEYDLMPPGSVFLDDYVQQEIFRNAKKESVRRNQKGVLVSPERVLEEWGFSLVPDDGSDAEVDSSEHVCHTNDAGEDRDLDLWPYSYYQLGTTCQDEDSMVQWQSLLIEELHSRGIVIQFAVGFTGNHDPYHIEWLDDLPIFYLADTMEPDEATARMLVEHLLTMTN